MGQGSVRQAGVTGVRPRGGRPAGGAGLRDDRAHSRGGQGVLPPAHALHGEQDEVGGGAIAGENAYVGRAGAKLKYALDHLDLDLSGVVAADFGCSVGGFTDCLLQEGAVRVYAVDTG
ncbi:MAG: hypothetical protein KAX19_04800, partial [Candidatus Brocadiae bacterium]|nr:hypothetical protein [Candidatus Brocadiia bacterium]